MKPKSEEPATTEDERLTVVIPCLNEEDGIERTVNGILKVGDELPMPISILMIDDGSRDRTRERMEAICEREPRCEIMANATPQGVGRSLMAAYERIPANSWVSGMPGDNELRFESIWNHMAVRHEYDLILGYYGNPVIRPFARRILSTTYSRTVGTLYGFPYRYLNGLKLFRVEVFRGIQVVSTGHAFNAELMAKAILRNPDLRIGEVPFTARGRAHGTSKAIRPSSVFKAIREVYAGRKAVSEYRRKIIKDEGGE